METGITLWVGEEKEEEGEEGEEEEEGEVFLFFSSLDSPSSFLFLFLPWGAMETNAMENKNKKKEQSKNNTQKPKEKNIQKHFNFSILTESLILIL